MLGVRCWAFDVGRSMLGVRCWTFDVGRSMFDVQRGYSFSSHSLRIRTAMRRISGRGGPPGPTVFSRRHAADKWVRRAAGPYRANHRLAVRPNQLPQVQCELFSIRAFLSQQLARKRGRAMHFYASFPTRALKCVSLSHSTPNGRRS